MFFILINTLRAQEPFSAFPTLFRCIIWHPRAFSLFAGLHLKLHVNSLGLYWINFLTKRVGFRRIRMIRTFSNEMGLRSVTSWISHYSTYKAHLLVPSCFCKVSIDLPNIAYSYFLFMYFLSQNSILGNIQQRYGTKQDTKIFFAQLQTNFVIRTSSLLSF